VFDLYLYLYVLLALQGLEIVYNESNGHVTDEVTDEHRDSDTAAVGQIRRCTERISYFRKKLFF